MNRKNIDHELCDYDEAYDRESANDIGWCGKCKIPECPYNKDLNEKKRMGWNYNPKKELFHKLNYDLVEVKENETRM
nr:MAG TPA: hypothetical protein [Caudoviricetes sp.]